jgi:hypothetical protein
MEKKKTWTNWKRILGKEIDGYEYWNSQIKSIPKHTDWLPVSREVTSTLTTTKQGIRKTESSRGDSQEWSSGSNIAIFLTAQGLSTALCVPGPGRETRCF